MKLAETAAAARGATRRSLVIMEELGGGMLTFDDTPIASATVKHLVETNKCLTLFATHVSTILCLVFAITSCQQPRLILFILHELIIEKNYSTIPCSRIGRMNRQSS